MFDALLFKKHPKLYLRCIRRTPPITYYAIVVAAAGLVVAAQLPRVSGIAVPALLLIWSVLTLDLCRRRLQGTSHQWRHVSEMFVTSLVIPFLSVGWRLYGAYRFRVLFL